ncbi:2-keto-4-pentenoate hydratase [Paracidobacterium acidisoli]|uniref:2-keto-4-pentenoate hydratase n=1 Tax=Paracidobacterium acidisoli TaxID=2303751 RepID=A0A372IL55_9BACT|nr:2-keto-4-pentenoate hydratase [Paracidobacterium acidisoli]MBT9332868.1 2-keto-4-pentenoate hydratase [Paracidobacterium acidisoli]
MIGFTSKNPNHLSTPDLDRLRQATEPLLRARRDVRPIRELPEAVRPHSLEEAYALQDLMAEALGPIGGWKIGALSPEATPLYCPMPLWGGFASSGSVIAEPLRRLRGIEAEIAFLLGQDLPPRVQPYSREEIVAAIASAHPVIELLESGYDDPDTVERFSFLGDLQINGGFAFGEAIPDWTTVDLSRESVTVTVDDMVRFEGTASNSAGTDLLRLVEYLANQGSARTGGLLAGQWVTTGSWSGKTHAAAGSTVEVRFSTCGSVHLRFA